MRFDIQFANYASRWSNFILVPMTLFFLLCSLLHVLLLFKKPAVAWQGLLVWASGLYLFGTSLRVKRRNKMRDKAVSIPWTTQEMPFNLPRDALWKSFRRVGLIMLPGLIIPVFFGLTVSAILLTGAILFAVLALCFYWTARYKWVYVSSSGLRGLTQNGAEAMIPWTEEMTVEISANSSLTLKMAVLKSAANQEISLPEAVINDDDFRTVLARFAPPGHLLVNRRSRQS